VISDGTVHSALVTTRLFSARRLIEYAETKNARSTDLNTVRDAKCMALVALDPLSVELNCLIATNNTRGFNFQMQRLTKSWI
jgi:hypothetical protein